MVLYVTASKITKHIIIGTHVNSEVFCSKFDFVSHKTSLALHRVYLCQWVSRALQCLTFTYSWETSKEGNLCMNPCTKLPLSQDCRVTLRPADPELTQNTPTLLVPPTSLADSFGKYTLKFRKNMI